MVSAISPMMNMYNPYMMGMGVAYNPYMMGMGMYPQTLEQYKNMQTVSSEMTGNQISFMGKINPFFSTSRNERMGFQRSMSDYQADLVDIYSPYSKGNIQNTKELMNMSMDYQQSMMQNSIFANPMMMMMNPMMNPFGFGMGCPTVI